MTDPTPPEARSTPPLDLPPVDPPSARFIIQLFVIPAAIVAVLVIAYLVFVQLPFGRLANGGRDVMDYVRSIKSENENRRWRSAQDLANLLNNDKALASDPRLLGELTALLDTELAKPDPDDAKLPEYLALALGTFRVAKAAPVDGHAVDPVETLARAVGREQPTEVRVAAAIALSWMADRAGGTLGDPSAARALAAASSDANAEVRQRASYALGFFRSEEALQALRARVAEDADAVVRYNAAAALARLGDPAGAPVLREMLTPADLAKTMKRASASETDTAAQAVMLEALWALQVSAPTRPDLARTLQPEIETLAKAGPQAVRVEAQALLKKLPATR